MAFLNEKEVDEFYAEIEQDMTVFRYEAKLLSCLMQGKSLEEAGEQADQFVLDMMLKYPTG